MNRDQFNRKHSSLHQAEIDRKWRTFMAEQEQLAWLAEASQQRNFNPLYSPMNAVGGLPTPASSGTIVFNGLDPGSGGSYVAAPNAQISTWLPGTGDFTVEWFQYQTLMSSHPRLFSIGPDTSAKYGVSIEGGTLYTWPNGNSWGAFDFQNTWVHIALVRQSGSTKCYIDGTMAVEGAKSDVVNITAGSFLLYIGSDGISPGDGFGGNITNFRWSNTPVYTDSFSPITTPLSLLPSTKLLLLGGSTQNPVVDSTGINTLVYSNITWSAASPFS